jgi:hypothetical protein
MLRIVSRDSRVERSLPRPPTFRPLPRPPTPRPSLPRPPTLRPRPFALPVADQPDVFGFAGAFGFAGVFGFAAGFFGVVTERARLPVTFGMRRSSFV